MKSESWVPVCLPGFREEGEREMLGAFVVVVWRLLSVCVLLFRFCFVLFICSNLCLASFVK